MRVRERAHAYFGGNALGPYIAAALVATGYHSLGEGGVGEGVSKAVTPQDRQVAAHAGNVDHPTRAAPAGRQQQQQRRP